MALDGIIRWIRFQLFFELMLIYTKLRDVGRRILMTDRLIIVVIVSCLCLVVGIRFSGTPYVHPVLSVEDLSHELSKDTLYWPGSSGFAFNILNRGPTPAGYWYEANQFETAEHGGTHLDAPAHFAEGKWRAHEIPAHRLIGPGVIINVTASASVNPDYRLNVSDILEWEIQYGAIPNGAIVLMLSGWASRYPNKTLTFNTKNVNDPTTFHFPGFDSDAIDWLLQNRNISMIGVDTPSTDFGQSTTFDVHRKIAQANVIGLENINNLNELPPSGSTIFVGLTKLHDGSGGPARIIALVGAPSCVCPKCGSSAGNRLQSTTVLSFVGLISLLHRLTDLELL